MKNGAGGFALIAVLVVLSVLLALATPFALSMGQGEAVTYHQVDEMQVDWGSASVRDRLLSAAAQGHPSVAQSIAADGLDDYPSKLELPEAFAGLAQGGQLLLAGEVWDLQRKLNLNSASPLLLANLLDVVAVNFDDGTVGRWLVEDFLSLAESSGVAAPACAQPLSAGEAPEGTDCLFILQAAVGVAVCDPECVCAPGGELPPDVGDALLCLLKSVGADLPLDCPCP